MKKIFTLILAVLYMTTSSGVVLNVHYCMGKASSVSIKNFAADACKCGKKESKSSCCQSETKVVKLSDDQNAAVKYVDINVPFIIVPDEFKTAEVPFEEATIKTEPLANAPPLYFNKLYLQNCVFLI